VREDHLAPQLPPDAGDEVLKFKDEIDAAPVQY
jgi:hypothetical protein